jgi:6-phosphogluconolactonase
MTTRRTFLSLAAASVAVPHLAVAQGQARQLALYANVGPVLTHYDVDVANATLTARDSVTTPGGIVQYCWPHRNRRYFYAASSSNKPGATDHSVTAYKIDPKTGALTQAGESIRLPARPIHMSLDKASQHILVAFNTPSSLHVYRINKDFTPGEEVPQGTMDAGIYAHQILATPDGRHVVLVARGNEGTPQKPEDPGALMVWDYKSGVLSNQYKIAPHGGKEYGPRHLDFHPTKPWMYVSIETQNQIHMHRMQGGKPLQEWPTTKPRCSSRTTYVHARRRARCTCIRTGAFCMVQTARRTGAISTASKSTRAARTALWCIHSISKPANPRRFSTSKRKRYIRALSTLTPAGA